MKRLSVLSAVSLFALTVSAPVFAQSEPAPQPNVGDIIVTAQKKSETLQKVPAAVAVLDSSILRNTGANNLTALSNLTSGVSIGAVRTQTVLFMRGVGQTLNSPNADAAVAVNLNGVYLPAEVAGTAFFDIDRIEILPGPQGTLYGRNSTGGVMNLSSKKPGNRLSAAGFLEIGNYDRIQAEIGIDVPITSTLKSRTVGSLIDHDGYWSNGVDAQRTRAIRETLVWTPTDSTTVTAVGSYSSETGLDQTLQNLPAPACGPRCATYDPKAFGHFNRAEVTQLSLQIDQKLSDVFTLAYIGGYNELDASRASTIFTGPAFAPAIIRTTMNAQSHELRLNGEVGALNAMIGLYYFDQDSYFYQEVRPTPTQHLINPFDGRSHGTAVFGQATYALTDALRLTGGLRYSNVVKTIDGFNSSYNPATTPEVLLFNRPYEGRNSLNRVDWKVGAEYDLSRDSMIYANIATGFNPGGFSTGPAVIGQLPAAQFLPVTLRAYTAGIKNRLVDGKLTFNLEAYYYDYKNYQVSARDVLTAQNLVFNAAKATIYGVQLDSRFAPTIADTFTLNVTYLHAVADRLRAGASVFDGFELPFAPKWTVASSYQHAFDLNNGAQIRAAVNFKYTSHRWTLYNHQVNSDQKANTHTDLNIGYYAPEDRWSIRGWVRNLENSLEKQTCANTLPGPTGCTFAAPRTFGGTVSFKY